MEKQKLMIFISQPMTGLTNEEIIENRAAAASCLRDKLGEKYDIKIINNLQMTEEKKTLEYLGYDIACMADADLVYFIGDWKTHRGCLVEEFIAQKYGYKCAYESEIDMLENIIESDKIDYIFDHRIRRIEEDDHK